MWRDPGNPKTMLHYAIPEGDVLRNRLRAARAWMGPWVQKVQSFQEFQDIETGSLANFDDIKSRLQCGTFQDYLLQFEDLFVGTGMLPSSVFHLKDMNGKCLTLDLYTKKLYLHDCIADCEGQIWHRSNSLSREDLQCCSGLKLWNYNYCLSWYGGDVQAVDCSYFGSSPYQSFGLAITESGEAMITAPALKDEQYCLNSGTFSRPVALLDITRANRTSTLELLSPGIFRAVTSSGLCLVSKLQGQAGLAAVEWGSCASAAALEVIGDSEGRKQLQVDDQCLDAAQGTGISLYPCHPPEERLPNQVFIAEEGGPLCWPFGDADDGDSHLRCLSEGKLEEPEVVLQPCANLPGKSSQEDQGQVFLKRSHGDSFILQSASGKCLSADLEHPVNVNGDEAFFLAMGKCSQRWMHQENAIAMKLRGDLWCLAASDFQRPVLTSCWPDDLTQHFETQRLGNSRVALRKRPHWADSGRERFPTLCLDTSPSHRIPIITAPCGAEQALWTTEWEEVPLETAIPTTQESGPSMNSWDAPLTLRPTASSQVSLWKSCRHCTSHCSMQAWNLAEPQTGPSVKNSGVIECRRWPEDVCEASETETTTDGRPIWNASDADARKWTTIKESELRPVLVIQNVQCIWILEYLEWKLLPAILLPLFVNMFTEFLQRIYTTAVQFPPQLIFHDISWAALFLSSYSIIFCFFRFTDTWSPL